MPCYHDNLINVFIMQFLDSNSFQAFKSITIEYTQCEMYSAEATSTEKLENACNCFFIVPSIPNDLKKLSGVNKLKLVKVNFFP